MKRCHSKPLRILCITDSLGLRVNKGKPDHEPEISFFEIAERILREAGHEITLDVRSFTGRTAETTHAFLGSLGEKEIPEWVLFHIGVVDCAPRIFGPRMRKVIGQTRPRALRDLFFNLLRKLHRRWFFKWFGHRVFLTRDDYVKWTKLNISEMRDKGAKGFLFSAIFPTNAEKENVYLGFKKNIASYNLAIRGLAEEQGHGFISYDNVFTKTGQGRLYDGIHPNLQGKEKLGERLAGKILEITTSCDSPVPVGRSLENHLDKKPSLG